MTFDFSVFQDLKPKWPQSKKHRNECSVFDKIIDQVHFE